MRAASASVSDEGNGPGRAIALGAGALMGAGLGGVLVAPFRVDLGTALVAVSYLLAFIAGLSSFWAP
jgi:hypothetical protein